MSRKSFGKVPIHQEPDTHGLSPLDKLSAHFSFMNKIHSDQLHRLEEQVQALEQHRAPPKWIIPTIFLSVALSCLCYVALRFI